MVVFNHFLSWPNPICAETATFLLVVVFFASRCDLNRFPTNEDVDCVQVVVIIF
jgi:hypothetical protein